MTPPVALSVATRLVVLAEPAFVFCNEKLTVTVSAGSIAPSGQLSLVSVAPLILKLGAMAVAMRLELLLAGFGSGRLLQTEAELV